MNVLTSNTRCWTVIIITIDARCSEKNVYMSLICKSIKIVSRNYLLLITLYVKIMVS